MTGARADAVKVVRQKTAIYVLVSVSLALVGVATLAWWTDAKGVAIATSLIAGAISSIGFAVIHHFDDTDSTRDNLAIVQGIESLGESLGRLDEGIEKVRAIAVMNASPNDRRIFERHPKEAVQEELAALSKREGTQVDALGVSLQPFYDDVVKALLGKDNVKVRLLVQDPLAPTFAQICSEQGRDRRRTASSIVYTLRQVLGNGIDTSSPVEIRCYSGVPSVTLTRVNKVVFVRPRFLNEANFSGSVFFERYDSRIDARCVDAFAHYFEAAWTDARTPTISELEQWQ